MNTPNLFVVTKVGSGPLWMRDNPSESAAGRSDMWRTGDLILKLKTTPLIENYHASIHDGQYFTLYFNVSSAKFGWRLEFEGSTEVTKLKRIA